MGVRVFVICHGQSRSCSCDYLCLFSLLGFSLFLISMFAKLSLCIFCPKNWNFTFHPIACGLLWFRLSFRGRLSNVSLNFNHPFLFVCCLSMKCHSILSQFRENKILFHQHTFMMTKVIDDRTEKSPITNKNDAILIDSIIQIGKTTTMYLLTHPPLSTANNVRQISNKQNNTHNFPHHSLQTACYISKTKPHCAFECVCCLRGHQCAIYGFDGYALKTQRILGTHTKHNTTVDCAHR